MLEAIARVAKELREAQAQLEAELENPDDDNPDSMFAALNGDLRSHLSRRPPGAAMSNWGHLGNLDKLRDEANRQRDGRLKWEVLAMVPGNRPCN